MQPAPDALEASLQAASTPKQKAGLRTKAIFDAYAGLPLPERASYTLDGYTVRLLSLAQEAKDHEGNVLGINVTAHAQDAQGRLLPYGPTNDVHRIINPPTQVPDGTVDAEGHLQFVSNPVAAYQRVLLDAILDEARRQGYVPQ